MNEWITDRVPVKEDADYGIQEYDGLVFATDSTGQVTICSYFWAAQRGFAWQPIMIPEPYVKPKRFVVQRYKTLNNDDSSDEDDVYITFYIVIDTQLNTWIQQNAWVSRMLPTKEAAEEIAAIYERVTQ